MAPDENDPIDAAPVDAAPGDAAPAPAEETPSVPTDVGTLSPAAVAAVAVNSKADALSLSTSQGKTFEFNGKIGHLTGIDVSRSAGLLDTSDLNLADGDPRSYEPAQLLEGDEVKIDGLFSTAETYPKVGDAGPLKTAVGDLDGDAVCTSASVVYSTGEVVKLSMAFKLGDEAD